MYTLNVTPDVLRNYDDSIADPVWSTVYRLPFSVSSAPNAYAYVHMQTLKGNFRLREGYVWPTESKPVMRGING